jgi:sodium transport system permease protein
MSAVWWAAWWAIFRKELVDSLRDRRTIMTMLFTGIAMGPIALVMMANYVAGMEEKSAAKIVLVDGIEHAPQLANFFARNGITPKPAPPGYAADIAKGTLQEAVVVVPKDFTEKYNSAQTVDVRLLFDDSRNGSAPSLRLAETALRGFSREAGIVRAIERGISPQLLQAVNVERVNTATPKQQAAFLLFLIPMFGLLAAVIGSLSVALDTTAGERERGSLEPLLMNPSPISALVVGKWSMVALFGSSVVLLTFAGFAIATRFVTSDKLATLFAFGLPQFVRFALVAVPFACMVGAVLMLIATFGRTYKEAQTYASYVALVVNFVPLITIFITITEATWQLFVPALAQQLVMSRILRGEAVGPLDYVIPFASAAVVTVVCLALLGRLLRREAIVFGR